MDDDYLKINWSDVKIQATIEAMGSILENGNLGKILEIAPSLVAKQSVRIANYVVRELQRNSSNTILEKEIEEDLKKILHIKEKEN